MTDTPDHGLTVTAINKTERLALRSDGEILPLGFLDSDGEPTQEVDEAVVFVCGSDDIWFTGVIADFETTTYH